VDARGHGGRCEADPTPVTDAAPSRAQAERVAAELPPLFRTPSLEAHLLAEATGTLDQALAALNADGRVADDPGGFAVLMQQLVGRLRMGAAPAIDELSLAFENRANRQVVVYLPVAGAFDLLAWQVRGMPPPALSGALRTDPEAARLVLTYEVKPGPKPWDAALDGDLAMIRAYMRALGQAVANFDQHLPALVEAKIRETLRANEIRREIADQMGRRGFRELDAPPPG